MPPFTPGPSAHTGHRLEHPAVSPSCQDVSGFRTVRRPHRYLAQVWTAPLPGSPPVPASAAAGHGLAPIVQSQDRPCPTHSRVFPPRTFPAWRCVLVRCSTHPARTRSLLSPCLDFPPSKQKGPDTSRCSQNTSAGARSTATSTHQRADSLLCANGLGPNKVSISLQTGPQPRC
jgi:hypothetical protein